MGDIIQPVPEVTECIQGPTITWQIQELNSPLPDSFLFFTLEKMIRREKGLKLVSFEEELRKCGYLS